MNAEERTPHRQLVDLRKKLNDYFGEEELRTLCFDIEVNYENLSATGKEAEVRELVVYLERRKRIPELIEICYRLRPSVLWHNIPTVFSDPERGEGNTVTTSSSNWDRQIELGELVLQLDPTDQDIRLQTAEIYMWRGTAMAKNSEHDKAIADLNRAIEYDPDKVDCYIERGRSYQWKGDNDNAIADYKRALQKLRDEEK